MENLTKQTHIPIKTISYCFVFMSLLSITVKSDEGFSYDPCSEKGPKFWGKLNKEWAKCGNGNLQSPIALSKWTADFNRSLGDLRRNHRPANAILKNDGHEIIVDWEGNNAGSIKINNIDYQLQNYHWHHPSEHTQDGKTYPLELHMVHVNNVTQTIAVIGVLFEYGPRDPFIYMVQTVSPYQVDLLKQAVIEEKNARPLQKINGRDVFFFDPF